MLYNILIDIEIDRLNDYFSEILGKNDIRGKKIQEFFC